MSPYREAQTKFLAKLHLFSGQFYSSGIASNPTFWPNSQHHNSICHQCQADPRFTQNRSPRCGGTRARQSCQKTWGQHLTLCVILDKSLLLSELVPHLKNGHIIPTLKIVKDQKLVEALGKREMIHSMITQPASTCAC